MIAFLLAAAGLAAPPTSAEPAPLRPPTVRGADLQLLEEVRRIAAAVERIRGQAFTRPPIAVRAPDPMREIAAEIRADNVLARERLAARGRAFADLGLGDGETPQRLLRLLAGDLEGVGYDAQGNRLLVAPERLRSEDFHFRDEDDEPSTLLLMTGVRPDEPVVGHVLMHVRQRERRKGDPPEATTDRWLADAAWAEGEANLVALRYLFEGMRLADEIIDTDLSPGDVLDGALLPPALTGLPAAEQALLRFVYDEGFAQVAARFRAGGWEAVDRATPRATTRDVLHPEGDAARAAAFERPAAPAAELVLADEDTLGEQAIVVLVSLGTGKDNLGLLAGEGWVGDRLYRWEPRAGDPATGWTDWHSRFRSASDAEDFAYGLERVLATRFPGASIARGEAGASVVRGPERTWRIDRAAAEVRVRIGPNPPAAPAGR